MPLQCNVVHSIKGRIRLRIKPYVFLNGNAAAFEHFLQDQEGIGGVRLNSDCSSLILNYHSGKLTKKDLLTLIEGLSLDKLKPYSSQSNQSLQAQDADISSSFPLILSSAAIAFGTLFQSAFAPWLLLGASVPIFTRALNSLTRKGNINVDVLDASATAVLSLQHRFNTAAVMVWLISFGNFIRDITVQRSHQAIEKLFDGRDQSVWIVRHGEKIQIRVEEVRVGDEVVIYPGELIPIDGRVIKGRAAVDQKILTGESMPVEKMRSDPVYSGTVVREGKLYIKAEKVGKDTMKSQIIQLVNNAPIRETKIQDYTEHFADALVPYSFLAAGISFITTGNVDTTASLLIVDYGTGIRIAAPSTVLSSLAKAARQGILIKGGRHLEILAGIDTIVFDKTGTLTKGEPELVEIISYRKDMSSKQILSLAASAEERLTHPVAEAIVSAAKQRELTIPKRETSEYTIGLGVEALIGGSVILVGCNRFMDLKDIKIGKARRDIARINGRAAAPLFVSLDGKLIGLLIYTDPIRLEAPQVIQALKNKKIDNIIMLTGDHPAIAQKVAKTLGIKKYFADVFPEEKANIIKSLQMEEHRVVAVGDGINDTPALVQADVGVAVHGGSDVAAETAPISLLEGGLWKIPQALDIARESIHLIHQNWDLNLYPNTIAIALALFGIIGPVGTTMISNGSAVIGSLNALRPLLTANTCREGKSR